MTDQQPGFEPLEPPSLDDIYAEERESVVERVDRYADLVFDDDEAVDLVERRPHHVVAVLVAHEGSRWLTPTMATIDLLDRAPDLIVAVDTGSTDGSGEMLRGWLGDAHVVDADPTTSFGAAVALGVERADELLAQLAAAGDVDDDPWYTEPPRDDDDDEPAPEEPAAEVINWIWVLHDDSAPDPAALQALLDTSDSAVSAGVLGPKVLGWHDRRLLLETGISIAGSGRRVTGLERGERDQGQHDGVRDVLAVGSAGLLVRRDVWTVLGGFDPNLPMFRDDIDFGWRANEAGYRVLVATDAVVHHSEAGIHGRRPLGAVRSDARRADRESAMHVLLAHSSALALPFQMLRLVVGALARSIGLLLAKAPDEAGDELGALVSVLFHPGSINASRRLVSSTRELNSRDLRSLRPRFSQQIRHGGEALLGVVSGSAATAVTPTGVATAGPSEDEAFDTTFDESRGRLSLVSRRPALLLVLLLTVVSLVSVRAWYTAGLLQGGALLPAPPGFGDLWSTYAQGWHEVGPGASTPAPPYLMVIAFLSSFLLGSATRAVDAILMVGIPVAAVIAYFATRRVIRSRLVRGVAACAYALLPAAVGAVATGRLGTVAFLVLLPALLRVGLRAPVSWRAAWGGAVLLAVVMAFVPLAWPITLILAVAAVVWATGVPAFAADGLPNAPMRDADDPTAPAVDLVSLNFRSRPVVLRLFALVVTPLLILLPWSIGLLTHPASWLLQAGLPGPVDDSLTPWQVALLQPGGPGATPVWFTVGILALAIGGLVRRVSRPIAALAWLFALAGLATGIVQTLVNVRPPSETLPLPTWPGPATVILGLGLIVAGAAAADGIGVRLAGDSFSWRQPAAVAAIVGAIAAPLLIGGWWMWHGVGSTVVRGDSSVVPAFVSAESVGPARPRSLVFTPSSRGIEYALIDGDGPQLGDAESGPPSAAYDQLNGLVADLVAGRGGGEIDALGRYGVRFVVLTHPTPEIVGVLDSEPGLRRISSAEGDTLWKLDTESERVRAVDAKPPATQIAAGQRDGAVSVNGPLPKGTPPRSALVMAESADPSWRATLNGTELVVAADTADGWRQVFAMPSGTGTLQVWFDQEPRHRWLWVQALILATIIVLARPGRRRPIDDPEADVLGLTDDSVVLPTRPVPVAATSSGPTNIRVIEAEDSPIHPEVSPIQPESSPIDPDHVTGDEGGL